MARRRLNGVISGTVSTEALIIDAIGGGICKKHGKYYGSGKYGKKDCPFCDIEEHYKKVSL